MWIHTRHGFYSAVYKGGDVQVRARVREDLERLMSGGFIPADTKIIETANGHADYRFRVLLTHAEWAHALGLLALDVDYPNFKTEVGKSLGHHRAGPLHSIWSILGRLQPGGPYARKQGSNKKKRGKPKNRKAGTRRFYDEPSLFDDLSVGFDRDLASDYPPGDEGVYIGAALRRAFSDDSADSQLVRGYFQKRGDKRVWISGYERKAPA